MPCLYRSSNTKAHYGVALRLRHHAMHLQTVTVTEPCVAAWTREAVRGEHGGSMAMSFEAES